MPEIPMVKNNAMNTFGHWIKHNYQIIMMAFFIVLGIGYAYSYLPQTYFLFDEWRHYQYFLDNGPFHRLVSAGIVGNLTGATRFLGELLDEIYLVRFGLNVYPSIITFFALHVINSLLLLKVMLKLRLHPIAAFAAAFFFAIASAGQQTLSWPAAGSQILGSTLFMLIALCASLLSDRSKHGIQYLFLAFICSYISFLWKPTGIVAPLLVVSLFLLFKADQFPKLYTKAVIILGFAAFILGVYRILIYFSYSFSVFWKAIFLSIFYPLVSLSHVFIPFRLMFRLSNWFTAFNYPQFSHYDNIEKISYYLAADFLSVVISLLLLFFFYLLYRKSDRKNKTILLFGFICYTVQFVPIAIFYMELGTSYIESRLMYTSLIGITIILGVFFDTYIKKFYRNNTLKRIITVVFVLLMAFWYTKELLVTRREVREAAIKGTAIKKTWGSLTSLSLPNTSRLILYIESPRTYYYPTYFLPFQLGSEYMMGLAFYNRPFMDKGFVDMLKADSYLVSDNKLFGIYTHIDKLLPLIKNNSLSIDDVYGFQFKDGDYTFDNITSDVRNELLLKNAR